MERKNTFSLLRMGLFMMFALLVVFGITSCSSDDDDEGNAPSKFEEPLYKADAAKFTVTDGSSEIKSIELTEAGNFIIRLNNAANYAPKTEKPLARLLKKNIMISPYLAAEADKSATRAEIVVWSDILYGKYTKTGDNEYTLDGYGTLTVVSEGGSAYSLRIKKTDGVTVDLEANKAGTPESGSMTDNLCRTWNIDGFRYYIRINGKTYFDETSSSIEELTEKLNKWMQEMDPDYTEDDSEILFEYEPKQFVFSKSGTYMVLYTNDMLAVSTWRWGDQSNGILEYSWNPDTFDDSDLSGEAKIEFSNNKLFITEGNSESEDGITFEVASVIILSEATASGR